MKTLSLNIANLSAADLVEAGGVLDAAFGRNGMVAGLRLANALQPESWVCARRGEEMIALVGAYNYGPFASIGMMAVAPAAQRQGVGEIVMSELMRYLEQRGCPLLFLDASTAGQHLYPRLGFAAEGETLRMAQTQVDQGSAATGSRTAAVRLQVGAFPEGDLPGVAAFDAPLFGADRRAVIAAYRATDPSRAFVARDGSGVIAGYVIASGNHIGPWSAATPEVAEALLSAALALSYSGPPILTCPGDNIAAAELLGRRGFVVTERLLHMRRGGTSDPRKVKHLYAQASLTLG